MSLKESTFDWAETPAGVVVRFPAPAPERRSVGCAVAFLVVAVVLALPMPVRIVWRLVEGARVDGTVWIASGIVMIVTLCLLWYAINAFREARLPPPAVEASVLSVAGGVLKIERAGRDRGMDYSWEVSEIADVRISVAAPDRVFVSIKSLLAQALMPEGIVRVSVERRSGEVDDVTVLSPGPTWTDALEAKLRAHLGFSSSADMVTRVGDGA